MTDDLGAQVRAIVMAVQPGSVITYGEIGYALGIGPRQAGRAVSQLAEGTPWWRVIRADGRPATCHNGTAPDLLADEGVPIRNGKVDLAAIRRASKAPTSSQ